MRAGQYSEFTSTRLSLHKLKTQELFPPSVRPGGVMLMFGAFAELFVTVQYIFVNLTRFQFFRHCPRCFVVGRER